MKPLHKQALDALTAALEHDRPACHRDARFIDDDVPAAALAPICAACPVRAACAAYGAAARPAGGVWAGRRYGQHRRAKEEAA